MLRIELRSKRLITTGIALAACTLRFTNGEDDQSLFPAFVNG